MSDVKLSIVIPTRNRADTLVHTFRAVTDQCYQYLEVFVSNNAREKNLNTDDSFNKIINQETKKVDIY